MQADSFNAKDLFEKNVRYVIPPFQRPYVWTKDEQWEPLWEDVEHAAERYLESYEEHNGDAAKAESAAERHFLGAIVVQQELTGSSEIETRNVIDGQQRLTTIQLLLDAAQEVAETNAWDDVAEGLGDLVLNNKRYARKDPDHIYKLWPTATDRDAFRVAMNNTADTSEFADSPIVKAHDYFRLRVKDWVERVEGDIELRTHAIETALLGLLELVVIDLGSADDAFVIFETLNARGTPLLASDLVKNYLMQNASSDGQTPDQFHATFWSQFESDSWWREEVRQGRLRRPRIDMFLDYWLELRRHEEVASHEVFPVFRSHVEDNGERLSVVAADLKRVGNTFRAMEEPRTGVGEDRLIYRWKTIDARTTTPLMLWLYEKSEEELPTAARVRCLTYLDSYLVRRMLCRLTTKDYNKFFLDVVSRLDENAVNKADEVLLGYLAEQSAETRVWPSDRLLESELARLPLYRLLTRGRLRIVLEAVEDSMRGPMTEQECPRGLLTIEHVLPQKWQNTWPIADSDDEGLAIATRDRLLHTIGNLTLVTARLNPSLSNDPWDSKKVALREHTVLQMNKQLLDRYDNGWSDEQIEQRSVDMARTVAQIWARPS